MTYLSYPSTNYSFNTEIQCNYSSINTTGVTPANNLAALLTSDSDNKWVQIYVPEVIDIPEQKPEVEGIVSINSCVQIISQRIIKTPVVTGYQNSLGIYVPGSTITNSAGSKLTGRKLIITGILQQKVIYTAQLPEQSLHSASYAMPFATYIIIDADTPLSRHYKISTYIEDVWAIPLAAKTLFKNTTIFIKATPIN